MKAELIAKILNQNPPCAADPDLEFVLAERNCIKQYASEVEFQHTLNKQQSVYDFLCGTKAIARWLREHVKVIE